MTLYFEDFLLGSVAESDGRTITESDLTAFAALSGDTTRLHTDEQYAAKSDFGRRIAHGALIFSISTGLMVQMNPENDALLAFSGVDKMRFVRPVFIGDTLRVRKKVFKAEPHDQERGLVTFETTVVNQQDQAVLLYLDRVLFRRRPPENQADKLG